MQINIEVFYYLIISLLVCSARHAQSTQNRKFAYLYNISTKTWGMKLIVSLRYYHFDTISLSLCGQARPNYQKWISLLFLCNILRKVTDEVELLHEDKYESFLKIRFMIFDGDVQVFPKFPK